jgi:hypothetical protein
MLRSLLPLAALPLLAGAAAPGAPPDRPGAAEAVRPPRLVQQSEPPRSPAPQTPMPRPARCSPAPASPTS